LFFHFAPALQPGFFIFSSPVSVCPKCESRLAFYLQKHPQIGMNRAAQTRVYKVNQEYADLFVFGTQDSRNLNEPLTNIKNGLGIFAGFSSGWLIL